MRREDSFETKIIRVALPIMIYYGIRILVQMMFGIIASVMALLKTGEKASIDYTQTYYLLDNTESYLQKYSLVVLFVAAALSMIFLWRMFVKDEKARERRIQIESTFYGKELVLIILLGMSAASGLAKLVNLIQLDNIVGSYEQVNNSFMNNPMIFQILSLCIAAPLVEELIYRLLVYLRLKEYMDTSMAVLVSALIFGVIHGNLVQGLYAGILGIILCYVYERYDTFLAPVLLHMTANTTALVMSYLPLSTRISENIVLRVLVMFIELALLAGCLYQMISTRKIHKIGKDA